MNKFSSSSSSSQLTIVIVENKKTSMPMTGGVDKQIGQALFYAMATQIKSLTATLPFLPPPVLTAFMAQGHFSLITARVAVRAEKGTGVSSGAGLRHQSFRWRGFVSHHCHHVVVFDLVVLAINSIVPVQLQ